MKNYLCHDNYVIVIFLMLLLCWCFQWRWFFIRGIWYRDKTFIPAVYPVCSKVRKVSCLVKVNNQNYRARAPKRLKKQSSHLHCSKREEALKGHGCLCKLLLQPLLHPPSSEQNSCMNHSSPQQHMHQTVTLTLLQRFFCPKLQHESSCCKNYSEEAVYRAAPNFCREVLNFQDLRDNKFSSSNVQCVPEER